MPTDTASWPPEWRENLGVYQEALTADGGHALTRETCSEIPAGDLGGIETGLRGIIRLRPLESITVGDLYVATPPVPTREEALRIKACLILCRNQSSDYLDLAVLVCPMGPNKAAAVLSGMDAYYAGQNRDGSAVSSQIVRQLADPQPKDAPETAKQEYMGALSGQWLDWTATVDACRGVAAQMLTGVEASWH